MATALGSSNSQRYSTAMRGAFERAITGNLGSLANQIRKSLKTNTGVVHDAKGWSASRRTK